MRSSRSFARWTLPRIGAVIVTAFLLGCPSPPDTANTGRTTETAKAEPERVTRKRVRDYPEPKPDMSLPLVHPGHAIPEFPALPDTALMTVERTGTYGGTLVYSTPGEIETFNPVEPKGATAQEFRALAFSGLVEYDNGSWEMRPALADRWEVSEDHKTWTFHLRTGLRWSDGEPLTLDDVKFSYDCIFDDRYPNSIKDGLRASDGKFPVIELDHGQNLIKFTTSQVDSQFLAHLGNAVLIPKHVWQEAFDEGTLLEQMTNDMDPTQLVGCGPFKLKQYVPAEKIEYVRNPYYWKVDARGQRLPYVDRVVIALVKDQNLQWTKFEAGEHHLLNIVPVDHFKEAVDLEKSGKARLLRLGVSLRPAWLCFNLHPGKNEDTGEYFVDEKKQRWFQNLEFRRALNHAIDREGLVKTALEGRGEAIWSSITPGNKVWHNPDVRQYEYDPEKSRQMLDAMGWADRDGDGYREDDLGNTIEFNMNTNVENNVRQQMGAHILRYFRDVGVKVNFKPLSFNDLITSLRDSHEWDAIILGWGSGVPPDPSNSKNILKSSGRLHVWYPQQPEPAEPWEARVDELVNALDHELDHEKRREHAFEIQALTAEHCPILYLVAPNSYAAAKPSVGNLWPSVLRPETTYFIEELFLHSEAVGQ